MPPQIHSVIGGQELGLPTGTWADLDRSLSHCGRDFAMACSAQLVRDLRLLLAGKLQNVLHTGTVQRIYLVMVTADRRARTPGVVHYLQKLFQARLTDEEKRHTAALAVPGLEGTGRPTLRGYNRVGGPAVRHRTVTRMEEPRWQMRT